MSVAVKAIPTRYRNIMFRSRLEARWAAFFDECEWDWTYEPEGLEFANGVRYLPDFELHACRRELIVEVRPVDLSLVTDYDEIAETVEPRLSLIPSDYADILLLGNRPWHRNRFHEDLCLGLLREWTWWQAAIFGETAPPDKGRKPVPAECRCVPYDFTVELGDFTQYMSGIYPGGSHPSAEPETLQRKWAMACNRIKWKP